MSKSWIFLLILVFLGILSSVAMFVFNKNEKTSSVAISPGSFEAHVKKDGNSITGQIRNMGSTISFRVPIAEATMSTAGYTTAFDTSHSAFAYEIKNNDKDKELKETITLKNANAPRMFSYRFIMENISSFNYDPAKKSWHFFNSNNKEVFYIPAGFMIDANGVRSNNVKIGIEKLEGEYDLSISVDNKWLNESGRAFPIVIDPSIVVPQTDTNYIIVTSIGRFRWKLAVEYDVRNSEGNLVGSDVVVIDTKRGESASDIFSFLGDYLTRRNAMWLLAKGNYTLYEMSFDRLSSPHFQANDNGDDVDDKFSAQRLSRKQIIDSITPSDYPVYSLTLAEAEQFQRPTYDEEDKFGNPTGKKLQSETRFIIANEKIGAGTEILRPNGAGDSTGICCQNPGSGAHWEKVDEVAADDATTTVTDSTTGSTPYEIDYYALTNTALTTEQVDAVGVSSRTIGRNNGWNAFLEGVRLSGSDTDGGWNFSIGNTWQTNTNTPLVRPGGGSWSVSDLNSLQAKLGIFSDVEGAYQSYGSQVYVTVTYSAGAATPTPLSQPININRGVRIGPGVTIRKN